MSAVVAVLAGGRGRRMGEPKPLAELGGAPLVARPLATIAFDDEASLRSVDTPADLAAARDELA